MMGIANSSVSDNKVEYYKQTFLILTVSQFFSNLSDRGLLVGLSWYFVNMYSASALTLYLATSMIPHLIMVVFSGRIINRYSPIVIMKFSELSRSIFIGILAIILIAHVQSVSFYIIIGLTTVANFFAAVFNPALLTVPRQLELSAEKYQRISGLLNSSSSIARIIGPILALPIFSYAGIKGLVLCCFILYFLAWIIEIFIKNCSWETSIIIPDKTTKNNLLEFIRNNHTIIKVLVIFFFINLTVVPLQLFMPLFVKEIFHSGLHVLTIFESSLGFGMLCGGTLITLFPWTMKINYRISIPYVLASAFYILYSLSGMSYVYSAVIIFLFGVFLAIGNVITISFYQQTTAKEYVAQVMVLVSFISNASGPIAMAITGGLLLLVNTQKLMLIYSVTSLIVCITLFGIQRTGPSREKIVAEGS